MKEIKFESNYGNFDYRLTAQVGDDVNTDTLWLATQGLANVGYRVCGSSVDKALGVKDRKAVAYSTSTANDIDAAVSTALSKFEAKDKDALPKGLKVSFAVTGEHQWGSAATPVFAREKKKFAEKESTAEGLDTWLAKFAGYTGPTHNDEGEYHPAALSAAKVAIDKFLAENI